MSEKHTPEPWETDYPLPWKTVEAPDGTYILDINENIVLQSQGNSNGGLDRIVAAINATAGIPTEALEDGALGELVTAIEELIRGQRRVHREAEKIDRTIDITATSQDFARWVAPAYRRIFSALAKLKGG